jgi:threonine/homoserine efflux transporter RhtA
MDITSKETDNFLAHIVWGILAIIGIIVLIYMWANLESLRPQGGNYAKHTSNSR